MKRICELNYKLVIYVLLVNLFLQSCNASNQLTSKAKQAEKKAQELKDKNVKQVPIDLLDKEKTILTLSL